MTLVSENSTMCILLCTWSASQAHSHALIRIHACMYDVYDPSTCKCSLWPDMFGSGSCRNVACSVLLLQKTFAPTIPTSRRIKKEPGEDGDESKFKQQQHVRESPKGKRRSSMDKKEGGRGKEQRKKGKKDVVTSASVFSMGPADRPMAGRTGTISIDR